MKNKLRKKQSQPSDRPLISLCMIARDNEDTIEDALSSASPWVDEIIVVDTGSQDRTMEIAQEQGAQVEHFTWCDDFATARNESLKFAKGEWVFWMDSDDTLPADCGKKLRETLESPIQEDVLGFIMQVHCPGAKPDSKNAASKLARKTDVTVVDHVKVIRNFNNLQFEGRIHEQVLPSIRAAQGQIEWTDCFVVHSGSDQSPEGVQRKLERDHRILKLDAEERPDHPFVKFNLGMTLYHLQQYEDAKSILEKCIASSTTNESHLRKAYVILIDSLEDLGHSEEAKTRCWEGLGRHPGDLELAFKLGRLLMLEENWEEAISAFQRTLNSKLPRYFSSMDSGIHGFKAHANLAICYSKLGFNREALDSWTQCLLEVPGFYDGWDRFLELTRATHLYQPLQRLVKALRRNPETPTEFLSICEAHLLFHQGRKPDAERRFESALNSNSHPEFVLNEFARHQCDNEQWQRAIAPLQKLKVLQIDNPSPSFNLGHSLMKLERFDEAAVAFKDSLKLRPGHKKTKQLLSQCQSAIATVE